MSSFAFFVGAFYKETNRDEGRLIGEVFLRSAGFQLALVTVTEPEPVLEQVRLLSLPRYT